MRLSPLPLLQLFTVVEAHAIFLGYPGRLPLHMVRRLGKRRCHTHGQSPGNHPVHHRRKGRHLHLHHRLGWYPPQQPQLSYLSYKHRTFNLEDMCTVVGLLQPVCCGHDQPVLLCAGYSPINLPYVQLKHKMSDYGHQEPQSFYQRIFLWCSARTIFRIGSGKT